MAVHSGKGRLHLWNWSRASGVTPLAFTLVTLATATDDTSLVASLSTVPLRCDWMNLALLDRSLWRLHDHDQRPKRTCKRLTYMVSSLAIG